MEMLVVITIISILAALLIPVVAGAIQRAQVTSNGLEISGLVMNIERYKSENGGLYPPSFGEGKALGSSYSQLFQNGQHKNTALYRYLMTAYPRISDNDINFLFTQVADNLDQSSALVFWLAQTSSDARFPFTNPTKRKYFDFVEKRLVPVYNSPGANNFPAFTLYGYKPPYAGESFYAYLEAKHYRFYVSNSLDGAQSNGQGANDLVARSGDTVAANGTLVMGERLRPYLKAVPSSDLGGPNRPQYIDKNNNANYVNSDSFQLLCAGLGGHFQANLEQMRRYPSGPVGSDFDNTAIPFANFQEDRDNQANFTEGRQIEDVQP